MEEEMTDSFYKFDPAKDKATRNGEPVTRAMMDALTAKAEREGIPEGLIPGGKSLSGGHRHSPKIQVVLSYEDAQKAREEAAKDGMSVSKWARRIILNSLNGGGHTEGRPSAAVAGR